MKTRGIRTKKDFSLSDYKKSNKMNQSAQSKPLRWIELSEAFQKVSNLPGIPIGGITLLRGHSDTGKTTALLEAAVKGQKMGILPVFLITEMKFSWEYAKKMGLDFKEIVDQETGLITYEGNFLYFDRLTLHSIEDVAKTINKILDDQESGKLGDYDLLFLWDSIGSIPCELSISSKKSNNEWDAASLSREMSKGVNQRIQLSSKTSSNFTNTLVAVNKVWVAKPESPMGKPKLENKGGKSMWYDASIILTFGNIMNPGTNKINAIKDKQKFEFAKRTKIQCDKNHINGISTVGKIIMTERGFIDDSDIAVKEYKDKYVHTWGLSSDNNISDIKIEIEEAEPDNIEYKIIEGGEVVELDINENVDNV